MKRWGVFTAMDGTLLDARTFQPGSAVGIVERLHAAGIPVVPVSVMTIEEIAPVADQLGIRCPMIIEGGGAIARWSGNAWELEPCGRPAEALLEVVREIEERSGANLLVYSALSQHDAALVSGRSGATLEASRRRRFSEPFLVESGDLKKIRKAAAEMGFTLRRGRRFFHLCCGCDIGEAAVRVRDQLACDSMIALGGSPIDSEFLSRADVPIIVPGIDGEVDAELRAAIPAARIAPAPAPDGWVAAVQDALHRVIGVGSRTHRA